MNETAVLQLKKACIEIFEVDFVEDAMDVEMDSLQQIEVRARAHQISNELSTVISKMEEFSNLRDLFGRLDALVDEI